MIPLHRALGAEFEALRPGSDFSADGKAALFDKVHRQPQAFTALCLSGGGIRSATFGLGVLQGLARHGLLQRFDYLSTVSGGGYIGAWLTAWVNRAGGIDQVIPQLRPDARPRAAGAPDPIGHLREYNSFMSPRRGLLSADAWTLAATILRNLLLNWMVLIPLLMAALIVPRLVVSALTFPQLRFGAAMLTDPAHKTCGECCPGNLNWCAPQLDAISTSWAVMPGLPLLMAGLFALALFNTLRHLPGVGDRNHSRADYWTHVLWPMVGAVLAYLAFDSLYYLGSQYAAEGRWWVQLGGALVAGVAAWLAYLLFGQRGSKARLPGLALSSAILVMAGGTGVAVWATANFLLPQLTWAGYVTLGPPAIVLGSILGSVLFVGLSSQVLKDEDREWLSRSMASMLVFCAAWTVLCACVLVVPTWLMQREAWISHALATVGAASAWLSAFGSTALAHQAARQKGQPGRAWTAAAVAVRCAPALFIVALAVGLSIATDALLLSAHGLPGADAWPTLQVLTARGTPVMWTDHSAILEQTHPQLILGLLALLLGLGWFMARYININTFSLHGMYRDRLVRAYLGASNAQRQPNHFTGFARNDDLAVHELSSQHKPLHVLNMTLNLASSTRLDWQQRMAQPFTVTALHCGNFDLGYQPSARYGGPRGLSLGTAAAISGAAASPSMGSYSSPLLGFIMTLLNARLGAWLGNPGPAGRRTWQHASPRSAIHALAREAFGLTSNDNPYVYLSDGGHFENLGLYEMVLRRCKCIAVIDADCDPDHAFNNLGNALRKVRIDLGVAIEFDEASMRRLRAQTQRCAVARIGYSAVDDGAQDGWLVYVKLMRLGNEPPDVDNYFRQHPDFPHQSTSDQWFDEAQTESYRMLGLHAIDEICAGWKGGSLDEFAQHVARGTGSGLTPGM